MTGGVSGRHLTGPATLLAVVLPRFATLVRAPNPGPMTLDGTNTWVLRAPGASECVVVDPGPDDETHLREVAALGPVALVLLTHGHPDHVGGLNRFVEVTGAQARAVDPAYCAAAPPLADEPLELAGLTIRPVLTPGHTADSVSFVVETAGVGASESAVLTGDTILGRGTTIVAWPDGNLTDYLASLDQLAQIPRLPPQSATPRHATAVPEAPVPALPGHGPALADCAAAATHYLAHRAARLDQVRAAVAAGAREPGEVVARVYADVDRALWPAAELTVRAQLAHLSSLDGAGAQSGDQRPRSAGGEVPTAGEAGEEVEVSAASTAENCAASQRLDRP